MVQGFELSVFTKIPIFPLHHVSLQYNSYQIHDVSVSLLSSTSCLTEVTSFHFLRAWGAFPAFLLAQSEIHLLLEYFFLKPVFYSSQE
jgi:hypothetical protein